MCTDQTCLHCGDTQDQDVRRQCQTADVIYEVRCILCHEQGVQAIYCGQTERPCADRFKEHLGYAKKAASASDDDNTQPTKKAKENAIGNHYFHNHRIRTPDDPQPKLEMKMIWKCQGSLDRDAMEATYVRREPRFTLNRKQQDNGIRL